MIKEAIAKVVEGRNLTENEVYQVMDEIMSGVSTPAQIGSFITALRMKGETVDEITGAARVMREKATKIKADADFSIDTCGTGGDVSHTFNISTISAIIVAGCGVQVAKHGNRAVSSRCGSADILEALGVNINAGLDIVEKCIEKAGIGFLFAPLLHGAMKYAIGPRREMGIRTVFNILGPLTNPAGVKNQLLGVYDESLTSILAGVLRNLGSIHAFVVHGDDGLDEITTTTTTVVSELKRGEINTYRINPEDFGLRKAGLSDLAGGDIQANKNFAMDILRGVKGPRRDIVLINSAAALVASDKAEDIKEGIEMSSKSIDSGRAMDKLRLLIKYSNQSHG